MTDRPFWKSKWKSERTYAEPAYSYLYMFSRGVAIGRLSDAAHVKKNATTKV